MTSVANIAVAVVALLHLYFLVLEMFLWDKPRGLRTFGLTPEFAAASKSLAANQGLYNGFLAAGLIWGLGEGSLEVGLERGLAMSALKMTLHGDLFRFAAGDVAGLIAGDRREVGR